MFARLGNFVSRFWWGVILFWIALAVTLRVVAPAWDDITHDGDFAYLPDDMPSVEGQRWMSEAFPHLDSKSQFVVVVARQKGLELPDDRAVALNLARRFENVEGAVRFAHARSLIETAARSDDIHDDSAESKRRDAYRELAAAAQAFREAMEIDRALNKAPDDPPGLYGPTYHNAALLLDFLELHGMLETVTGLFENDVPNFLAFETPQSLRDVSYQSDPNLHKLGTQLAPVGVEELPVQDVMTFHSPVFGKKLRHTIPGNKTQARLVVVKLTNEFMATDNLRVREVVEHVVTDVRQWAKGHNTQGLKIGISGSAAVGSDLLLASKESIANTELVAILLVVTILICVYRSPLLVAVPLATIVVSLVIATAMIALLTQLHRVPGFEWWDFKVFKTTKIFIVVILYGAGTDYCLFLISRYREELSKGLVRAEAVAASLAAVGDALAASALTTIIGLGMMFFADFGKFRNSGPAIGLCLAVTLVACVTLTPALLRMMGRVIFWPFGNKLSAAADSQPKEGAGQSRMAAFWLGGARRIVAYPGRILVVCFALLFPLALYGIGSGDHVTYDVLRSLHPDRPSRQGTQLLIDHFPVGESGPIVVLAKKDGTDFLPGHETEEDFDGQAAIWELAKQLHALPRVRAVRSYATPLGEPPTGSSYTGLSGSFIKSQQVTKSLYVTPVPALNHSVTRFEIVLDSDAFSVAATEALSEIDDLLQHEQQDSDSFWSGTEFAFAGTTAAIRDLRSVTRSDNSRIQVLVVVAVLIVLLLILRRPVVCVYMILSVLFTYYVTIGATELFFGWAYGESFQGLDWKVPLFLFVILVAIGQDYNVYLATRVFEEQRQHGALDGLRRAVVSTGGIITSCGVIMAGTFISMTSGTWGSVIPDWMPLKDSLFSAGGALRGIVELGFALALGVLLDTFIVRTVLLPAFLAIVSRWQTSRGVSESPSLVTQDENL